jgi:hypothetical protein
MQHSRSGDRKIVERRLQPVEEGDAGRLPGSQQFAPELVVNHLGYVKVMAGA